VAFPDQVTQKKGSPSREPFSLAATLDVLGEALLPTSGSPYT
jgi:hypothetical protein